MAWIIVELKRWMNLFSKTIDSSVPHVDRSPLARFLCCLTRLACNQFLKYSLRTKVWLLMLFFLLISWMLAEKCMWVLAFFEWLNLEGALIAFFDEDSRSTAREFYPYFKVLVLVSAFMFLFFNLSPIEVLFLGLDFYLWLLNLVMKSYEDMFSYLLFLTEIMEAKVIYVFSVVMPRVVSKVLDKIRDRIQERWDSPYGIVFTEPFSDKLVLYFFGSSSKKEKSLLVKCFNKVFDAIYKLFVNSSLQVKVPLLFLYFLIVLYLVTYNYEWVLAPFSRDVNYADEYTILLKLSDRKACPIIHGVYSISWLYVIVIVAILCLNLSPERMLSQQYLLLLVPFFRSYFWAVSSNVFLVIAVMVIRACFFYNREWIWTLGVPLVFCLISLFLLDLTICLEDLGKDNIFRI